MLAGLQLLSKPSNGPIAAANGAFLCCRLSLLLTNNDLDI